MKHDSYIRASLIIIVTLLALNIILTILSNPPTSYAAKNIEYKVINPGNYYQEDAEQIEKLLNEYGKEGWEYISLTNSIPLLVFKR